MLLALLGVNFVFGQKPQVWMDCGGLILFYGLYYGVLGQDLAEICSNKMALHIGVSIKCLQVAIFPITYQGLLACTFKLQLKLCYISNNKNLNYLILTINNTNFVCFANPK